VLSFSLNAADINGKHASNKDFYVLGELMRLFDEKKGKRDPDTNGSCTMFPKVAKYFSERIFISCINMNVLVPIFSFFLFLFLFPIFFSFSFSFLSTG